MKKQTPNSRYDELHARDVAALRAIEQEQGPHVRKDVHTLSLHADLTPIKAQLEFMRQRGTQRFSLDLRGTPLANAVHYLHALGFTVQDVGNHAVWVDTTGKRRDEFPLVGGA